MLNRHNLRRWKQSIFGYVHLAVGLLCCLGAMGQQELGNTLSPVQFMEIIRQYHPVARQTQVMVDQARAELLSARGAFDPLLYFNNDQKTFDGKNYFNYNHTQLKIPTWFGVEVMAGLESNIGEFTNPEITRNQSSYAGFSVPLAKNLVLDKRRAVLEQSKIFVELSKNEQRNFINDLLFEGLEVYWQWARDYQNYLILTEAVKNNEDRYKVLRITVEQGDRAGIDSTEALTLLLQFRFLQNEAYMQFVNTGYLLSTYLWAQNDRAVQLPETVVPSVLPEAANPFAQPFKPLSELLELARTNHPKLQMIEGKLDILEVERRLKFQSLLPTVNLKYNALNRGYDFWNGWGTTFQNNYKFGAEVGIPLFLRQGRGDYRSAKLKIQGTTLEQSNVEVEIENKVKAYYNELINLLEQIRINERALEAYRKVFDVELQKFEIGESTLFLINARELKVIESRQKVADLKGKFFKTAYGVEWSAGLLQ